VIIWDEVPQRQLTFLTNLMHLAASTIAAIYTERRQIALLAMLLLKFLPLKSTWPWSLSNLATLRRFKLLTYRDLWAWLDAPFERPSFTSAPTQGKLFAA
jgi:hypothetical protein